MAATAWLGPRWRLPTFVAFVVAAAISWPAAARGNQFVAAPGAQYTFNGPSASQMVSGDFNNDGISDLAVATTSAGQNGGQGELWVLLGSASAPPTKPGGPIAKFTGFTPTPASPIEVGPPSQGLVEGDFNGDGKLDLAYEASMGGGLMILLGNGSGGFTAAGPPIYVAGSLAVGQFTAGRPDEIAVLEGSKIQVIGETGTNQFGVVATSSPSIPDVQYLGQIAAGRFANSSDVDLAALDDSTGNVSILLGNGKGDFKLSPTSPVDTGVNGGACVPGVCLYSADSIAVGNFSSSGYSDLAVGTADGRVAVLLAKGDAAGDFAPATGSPYTVDPSGGAVDSLVTAPFSQNSTLDGIATADYFQGGCSGPCTIPSDSVGVLDPTGSGALTPAQGSPYDDGGVTVAAAAGDVNGDGLPDLAFDDSNDCQGDGIGVMINQGSAGGTPSTGVYPADNCQIPTPTVTLGQPSGVSLHGATLNGTVENNYQTLTGCMFQYGETSVTQYSVPCTHAPSPSFGVSAMLTNLPGLKNFQYQLVASTAGGTVTSPTQSFQTCQATSLNLGDSDSPPVATGCFTANPKKKNSDQTWNSTGKVTVNGLNFMPAKGGVTIDPNAQTLHSDSDGSFEFGKLPSLPFPKGLTVNFSNNFTVGGSHTFKFGGFQIEGAVQFALLPGAEAQVTGQASMNVLGSAEQASVDMTVDGDGIVGADVGVGPAGDSALDPNTLLFCDPKDKKQPEGFSCKENKLKDGKGSEWVLTPVGSYPTGNDQFLNPSCDPAKAPPIGWSCEPVTLANGSKSSSYFLVAQNPAVVKVGPIGLEGLDFGYDSDGGTWSGQATIQLGGLLPSNGILGQASTSSMLQVNAQISTKPSFQIDQFGAAVQNVSLGGATINSASFELELHPHLDIKGNASFAAGPDNTFSISGGFDFGLANGGFDLKINGSYAMETYTVGGDIEVDTEDHSFKVLVGGSLSRNFGPISATVDLGGGMQFHPFRWQVTADGTAGVFGQTIGAQGVVSNAGLGLCGHVSVLIFSGDIGFKHFWNGGWDWNSGCDFSGLYTVGNSDGTAAAASATAGQTVHVASGTAREEFAAVGAAGPPDVVLTGPGGQTWTTPASEDKLQFVRNGAAVAVSSSHTTYFDIDHPSAGSWTIAPAGGQPAPQRYELAAPLAALHVRATVKGTGGHRVLRWKLNAQRGESVHFVQEGGTPEPVATTSAARGRRSFRIAPGAGGRRTILAIISIDGFPTRELTVARFRAPAPVGPRVTRASYRIKGQAVSVRWRRPRGVASYEVDFHLRHGLLSYVFRARSSSANALLVQGEKLRGVEITATGTNGVAGKSVKAHAASTSHKRRRKKHHR